MQQTSLILSVWIALLLLGRFDASAQVDLHKIALMRSDYDNNARVILGSDRNHVTAALGSPDRVTAGVDESGGVPVAIWHYGANELVFFSGRLASYEVNDQRLKVGTTFWESFTVGDPIGRYEFKPGEYRDYFYGYHLAHTPGVWNHQRYHLVSSNYLSLNGTPWDGRFYVLFDTDKTVIKILVEE